MDTRDRLKEELAVEILTLRKRMARLEKDHAENMGLVDRLRLSGRRYQLMVENACDMIALLNMDSLGFQYCNPTTFDYLGYTEEEILGHTILDILHPDDVDKLMHIVRSQYDADRGRVRLRYCHKCGNYLWVDATWKIGVDDDNQKIITLLSREINEVVQNEENTAQKIDDLQKGYSDIETLNIRMKEYQDSLIQSNAQLIDSEERLELALWGSNEFMWDWSLQKGTIYINDSWANVLGYDWQETELPYMEWQGMVHAEDLGIMIEGMKAYFEGHRPMYEVECRVQNGRGQWSWIQISGKLIFRDKTGHTLRAVGLCKDITARKEAQQELFSIENERQLMLGGISELVVYEDMDHNILWCNQSAEHSQELFRGNIIGEKCYRVWYKRNEPCPDCLVSYACSNGGLARRQIKTADGKVYDQHAYPLKDEKGTVRGNVIIFQDITVQHHANQELQASERRYRTMFERNPVGLFKYDTQGNITDANRYIVEVLGASSKEDIPDLSSLATSEKEMALIRYELLETIREGKSSSGEIHFISAWGREVWLQYKADPVLDSSGNVAEVIVACEEISERKQAEERIRFLSFNDPLTGLYNRAFFYEELKRLDTQRQLPLSLIMGDMNSLKLINDAFGHHKGDVVLRMAAEALRASCRREDIIARLGGDEFVVLLPNTNAEAAQEICDRITKNCLQLQESSVQLSLALGMATRTDINQSMEDVLREAEDRMYRNKLIESRSIRSSFIISLERTLREKSHETEEHTMRLRQMSSAVGKSMKMSEGELDALNLLAALHDIGKIAIPSSILDKASKLTIEEWDTMKKHPEIGYRIALSTPELVPIAEAILAHHESWNGNGYPLGLREEKIPLLSRILAVCDTYDVMVNGRPYRNPISKQEAMRELQRCAGTQFDPEVVRIFSDRMLF